MCEHLGRGSGRAISAWSGRWTRTIILFCFRLGCICFPRQNSSTPKPKHCHDGARCVLMRLLLLALSACASTALSLLGGPQLVCAEAPTASRPRPLLLSAAPPPPPPRSSSKISVSNEMLAIGLPALAGLAVDPVASLVDTGFVGRMCGSGPLAGAAVASECRHSNLGATDPVPISG